MTLSGSNYPTAINQSREIDLFAAHTISESTHPHWLDQWVGEATSEQVVTAFSKLFFASPERAQRIPCLPPLGDWSGNRVSSGFGLREHPTLHTLRHHDGIDIAGPHQYVRSAASGLVATVGYSSTLGRYVKIDHGNSYQTVYGHLALTSVRAGQWVVIGETLGITGSTGRATGVHLHYCVLKHHRAVNPADYLTLAIRFVAHYQQQQRTQTR
ncbi:M23 family metallopeptidase [Rudanella lutea]|uniref:M23 family metallopeptidase n=1 Tax=Rudanella lutea TaxID=451374 RepID=UPI001FDF7F32|nr:M23 family metallopeptidase [Rudanella lutea]